jgi:C1A family cysteine protease
LQCGLVAVRIRIGLNLHGHIVEEQFDRTCDLVRDVGDILFLEESRGPVSYEAGLTINPSYSSPNAFVTDEVR